MAQLGDPVYPPENDDFQNAHYGQIYAMPDCIIESASGDGTIVWDNEAYRFLRGDAPTTVNPSLWRQGKLCRIQGLFQIADQIFQVRGFDIANMSFVENPTGTSVVIVDCLASYECAKQALKVYQDKRPQRKIQALIYTHCHEDHFGGVDAVLEVAGADLKIYAPDGFLEHAVSENVYAGNAMSRRAVYMYGNSLETSPTGQVGCGLGIALSSGKESLASPTENIKQTSTIPHTIDDLQVVFQVTPGTEAPAEMNFHFPQYNALCMAENLTHTMHNIQTLRGAPVRDARMWSRYLDEALVMFGPKTDIVFASHHWPMFGNENILQFMAEQRDLYAYLNNETLRLLNAGQTGIEIAEDFELPPTLDLQWNARGYYGSVSHNVKAIYDHYMGWFDGNPAHLWEHPPVEAAKRYMDCMGGADKVLTLAGYYKDNGDLRFAATLLNHAVFADQTNKDACQALSDVYTQLGFGCENATWRNIYLTGAKELIGEIQPSKNVMSATGLKALSNAELADTMAIRVNGRSAWDHAFTIDVFITDETNPQEKAWHWNLSNGALTGHATKYFDQGQTADPAASLSIWPTRLQWVELISGAKLADMDNLTTAGDVSVWDTLTSLLTTYDTGFAIVTPEKPSGQ